MSCVQLRVRTTDVPVHLGRCYNVGICSSTEDLDRDLEILAILEAH